MKKIKKILLFMLITFLALTDVNAIEYHEVTFKVDDIKTSVLVENDNAVLKISDPVKTGYVFNGWYLNNNSYDFTKPVTTDLVLEANFSKEIKEFKVDFKVKDEIVKTVMVKENNQVLDYIPNKLPGYTFINWQLDDKKYDFNSLITSDITLNANFESNGKYVVNFILDNTIIESLEVLPNNNITKITDPIKDGYIFKEWLFNDLPYDFNNKVETNLNLVASFTSNPGEIYIEKYAQTNSDDNRSADVTLKVNGNSYTDATLTDVVLVLDRSSSMSLLIPKEETTKIVATKEAAIKLINKFLPDSFSSNNVKVGVVVFGTNVLSKIDLTNNKEDLLTFINKINNEELNEGTNIDEGLHEANNILNSPENSLSNKYVLLLTDGEPTFFTDDNNIVRGEGNSNKGLCYADDKWYPSYIHNSNKKYNTKTKCEQNNGVWYEPGSEAIKEADNIKYDEKILEVATIFTIGFDTNTNAENLLKDIATSEEHFFKASSKNELLTRFDSIFNSISTIANNIVVTDIVSNKFNLSNIKTELGTVNSEVLNDGTTKITWTIGDFNINNNYQLNYKVIAKDPYYGSMYTNDLAKLTGVIKDNNPCLDYKDNKNIELIFNKPYVPIVSKTKNDGYDSSNPNNDKYTVKRGEKLIVKKDIGLLANDFKGIDNSLIKDPNKNITVTDEIIVLNDSLTKGTVLVNNDGSFTYLTDSSYYGLVTFKYFIRTTINDNNKITILDSNISSVTINVLGYGKVISKYIYKDSNGNYVDIITEDILTNVIGKPYETEDKVFDNYKFIKLSDDSSSITGTYIDDTLNVIRIYEKILGKVIIKYEDTKGNSLSENIILEDEVGKFYESKELNFKNYKLSKIIGDQKGEFSREDITITYIYELEELPIINTGIFNTYLKEIVLLFTISLLVIILKKRKLIKK